MTRDCKHGRLARSCETCEWEARALNAETLAREAGELMMVLHPECKVPGCPMNDFYTKLRAAGLIEEGRA